MCQVARAPFAYFYSFFFHTFRCFYEAMRFQTVIQHDPFYSFYSFYVAFQINGEYLCFINYLISIT